MNIREGTELPEEKAPEATTETQPNGGTTETTATEAPPAAEPPKQSLEELQKALADATALVEKERKDRQEANREAKNLRDRLKAIDDANLTEQEKVARERDELKAQLDANALSLRQERIGRAVAVLAAELGMNPEIALRLLKDDAKLNDDGTVDTAELKATAQGLIKSTPGLVAAGAQSNTANPARNGEATNASGFSDAQLREMLYGGSSGAFGRQAELQGGGVTWPTGSKKE